MRIEVAYDGGRVSITPLENHTRFETAERVIARSEQTLAQVYVDQQPRSGPLEALKSYFKRRGWYITKEGA